MSLPNTQSFSSSSQNHTGGPIEQSIRAKLEAALEPDVLTIANDSWKHSGHAAMREIGGGNGETHFAVEIVSKAFEGKRTIQRHRLIYAVLDDELKNGVHALQLTTRTPSELKKN
ncbi:bola-like protein [Serendipita vermifera]|nr:bola-like protein [Serendipita vermifera]